MHKNERMHQCMKVWVEEWECCHPAWIRYLNIMIKSLGAKQSLNILKHIYNEGQIMKKSIIGSLVFNSADLYGKVQNDRIGSQNVKICEQKHWLCVFITSSNIFSTSTSQFSYSGLVLFPVFWLFKKISGVMSILGTFVCVCMCVLRERLQISFYYFI